MKAKRLKPVKAWAILCVHKRIAVALEGDLRIFKNRRAALNESYISDDTTVVRVEIREVPAPANDAVMRRGRKG